MPEDEDLVDQGHSADNDEESSEYDATERNETGVQVDTDNNAEEEPATTMDWKNSQELGEQSSSKLRNNIEFAFVEVNQMPEDEDLVDQGHSAENDEKPSDYDATEMGSETGVQVVTDNNGEEVPAMLENTASHGTPEYRNEEDQEYQLRLLFSTPTTVRGTGEEKCKTFTIDSNTSSHMVEFSNTAHTVLDDNTIALNNAMESEQDVRNLLTTNDDLYADGNHESIPDSEYEGRLNEVEHEDQPILLDSDTSDQLIETPKTEVHESDLLGNIGSMEEISNEPFGTQGNPPCLVSTPFKEEHEVAKEKCSDTEGSFNSSDNTITNPGGSNCLEESCEVESLIITEALVASDDAFHGDISQDLKISSPVENRSGEEDDPLKNTTEQPEAESATPSTHFALHVESTITTSTSKYIVKDEDMKGSPAAMVHNANTVTSSSSSSIFFSSPSKLHAIFEEIDKFAPKPTSATEDSPVTVTNIDQPLTVAEMNQVEPDESKSRSSEEIESPPREAGEPEEVLPVYESPEQPSSEEIGCRLAREANLRTPQEEMDSDVDKGLVEDASIEKPFSTEINSLTRNSDTRSILIHATPFKQPVRVDMKENDPVSKRELAGSLTAARTEKRRPLKDL